MEKEPQQEHQTVPVKKRKVIRAYSRNGHWEKPVTAKRKVIGVYSLNVRYGNKPFVPVLGTHLDSWKRQAAQENQTVTTAKKREVIGAYTLKRPIERPVTGAYSLNRQSGKAA